MAINFAVRGDSLDARYSSAGATPGMSGTVPAHISTDEPGINGSTSIDLVGAWLTQRPMAYIGRENTPSGKPRSVLVRAKFASFGAALGLFHMGIQTRNQFNSLSALITTGGEVTGYVSNAAGQTDFGTTTGAALTNTATDAGSTVWHDIVLTWTGDTAANGFEIWVDGTRRLQDTMIRSLPTYTASERLMCANIQLGATGATINTHMSIDEIVVWDSVITPTSVGLTSGTGSLNGSSRTAYVDVTAYDGAAPVAGGSVPGGSLGRFGF